MVVATTNVWIFLIGTQQEALTSHHTIKNEKRFSFRYTLKLNYRHKNVYLDMLLYNLKGS